MADHFILVHGYSKAEVLILTGQALQFAIGPIAILFPAYKLQIHNTTQTKLPLS